MNDGTPIQAARNVELGASGEEYQNLHEFVHKARAKLNQNAWDYIVGASETETTMRRNRMALDEIAFRPRVLRNVADVDPSMVITATVIGATFRYSLLWAVVLCIPFLITVFGVTGRIGHETRQGLVDLLRQHYEGDDTRSPVPDEGRSPGD